MAKYPAPNGVQSTGTSSERARLDHVHPSDSSKVDKKDLARVALTGSYNDLTDKPEAPSAPPVTSVNNKVGDVELDADDVGALPADTPIPAAVTEQTVAGWGFTKNTGDYTKPSTGIPDSDIASAANWNAKGTYSKPSGGIPKSDLASDVQASLGKADTALQEIADVIYDIPAEFHAETSDHYFTFASGVNASTILSALNAGKLPIVRNNYGSLKRKWFYADYNDDGTDIYIQFFRQTQFGTEVMLYTESTGKAYVASTSLSSFQRKPVVVWEVQDALQGLLALNTNISSSLAWQLTDLDLTPFKRIKIYVRAGRKTGSLSADSSITPASIIEMSLDDRAKETVSQNAFLASSVVQNPNDPNRLGLLTCAVSGDKTKFAVLRATTLYGTAATSNTDAYPYVFLIEGYYD